RSYPSDITDNEWRILEPLIPPAKPGGHPRTTEMREVINAILYLNRTGSQWRALPHEFPPWSTVWSYFRKWRNSGLWKRMHTALREWVRSEEHTSELQSLRHLVCRLLLEKKKKQGTT